MYCTTEELIWATGSELSQLVLEGIIDQADRQIKGRLMRMDVGAPDADDTLKSASLSLSTIGVIHHPDSDQMASSVKLGDITIKRADVDATIVDMTKLAFALVDNYILQHGREDASKYYFRKVN